MTNNQVVQLVFTGVASLLWLYGRRKFGANPVGAAGTRAAGGAQMGAQPSDAIRLQCIAGPDAGQVRVIGADEVSLGRVSGIGKQDPQVAEHHVAVSWQNNVLHFRAFPGAALVAWPGAFLVTEGTLSNGQQFQMGASTWQVGTAPLISTDTQPAVNRYWKPLLVLVLLCRLLFAGFKILVVILIYSNVATTPFEIVVVSIVIFIFLRVSDFASSWHSAQELRDHPKDKPKEALEPLIAYDRIGKELIHAVADCIVLLIAAWNLVTTVF